jgi:hypothetical protein
MTRLCIVGLMAAALAAGPALAFDGPAGLPKDPRAERSCLVDGRITLSGTIQDMMSGPEGWSAGVIARGNPCTGLTDPSTGFTALFGDGKPPPRCEHGSQFWASGTARSGLHPESFLNVESIKCE